MVLFMYVLHVHHFSHIAAVLVWLLLLLWSTYLDVNHIIAVKYADNAYVIFMKYQSLLYSLWNVSYVMSLYLVAAVI